MFGLVNVGGEWNNARDTSGISLARTSRGSVHDAELGIAQKVGRTTETVEHARATDHGRVGMGVDIDFDGSVHGNATKATDDFGRVGDLLRAQQKAILHCKRKSVILPSCIALISY